MIFMQEQAIKDKVKEKYGEIALTGYSENCCVPTDCCSSNEMISAVQMAKNIGYDAKELETVPGSSILGVDVVRH